MQTPRFCGLCCSAGTLLFDTAGLRRRGHIVPGIEKYSSLRALRAIERADVALLVIDAVDGVMDVAFENGLVAAVGPDFAAMYRWFNREGYKVDIEALRRMLQARGLNPPPASKA